MTAFTNARWRKSSFSVGDVDQCVELASALGLIGVRDSKSPPSDAVLVFGRREFVRFAARIKRS
ncbi:hypothetical protein GCM10027589_03790 [Actinocorallia lasiicapitis]